MNTLSKYVEITGDIQFKDALTIDGKVTGQINSEGVLTVGENATIVLGLHLSFGQHQRASNLEDAAVGLPAPAFFVFGHGGSSRASLLEDCSRARWIHLDCGFRRQNWHTRSSGEVRCFGCIPQATKLE